MQTEFEDDPILRPAYAYWLAKCHDGRLPGRRDIDPIEIPRLLPHLMITELVDGGTRLRYRLVGTVIVAAYGGELRGKYCDEVWPAECRASIIANYRLICERRRPLLIRHRYVSSRNRLLVCHRVEMPLSDDGLTVNHFLAAVHFEYPGEAHEWVGRWADTTNGFTFEHAYSVLVA